MFEGIERDPGAGSLGFIHGGVRASEQDVRIFRMPGKERDPDAGSNLERLLERLEDPCGRRARSGFVDDARENDGELVAAKTGDRV